uniref:Uncharacterized protein n=1 Tax=Tanacetum cinerariifolium TaxID=118510 RepID=A0A699IEG3_TANCI|nr:hypothetical protein [Tanacetum cinerariifolium]
MKEKQVSMEDKFFEEVVTPFVVGMNVEKEKLSSLEDTTSLGLYPSLSTHETTSAGNAPGKSSYANVMGKPSRKKLNIHTLFTLGFSSMDGLDVMLENGPWFIRNNLLIQKKQHLDENLLKEDVSTILVWVKLHGVPVTAFSDDGLSAIATKLCTPRLLASYTSDMCMHSWGRSSYARVMIELRADVELKDNIIIFMPRIKGATILNTGAGEKKTVKKPSQTSRGVAVGPKIGFKPQKEYRPVSKKPNASSSGNKKKGVEPTIEISNSNLFGVLNSIVNDVEFGTNGWNINLVNNKATLSRSSFMNINNDGEFASNTPIREKIDKIE